MLTLMIRERRIALDFAAAAVAATLVAVTLAVALLWPEAGTGIAVLLALALIPAGAVLVLVQRRPAGVPEASAGAVPTETAAESMPPGVPSPVPPPSSRPAADPPPPQPPAGPDRWTRLVEECVELSQELDGLRVEGRLADPELAEHVLLRMQQILERCGVESIADPGAFDRRLHRPTPGGPKPGASARVAEVLSPGFRIGERVLLRARVRLSAAPAADTGPDSA